MTLPLDPEFQPNPATLRAPNPELLNEKDLFNEAPFCAPPILDAVAKRHPHYYKDVRGMAGLDVYRVLTLFNVTDPCIQHAIKKLLVAGGRGAGKGVNKDVQEAIDSLVRYKEMRIEEMS